MFSSVFLFTRALSSRDSVADHSSTTRARHTTTKETGYIKSRLVLLLPNQKGPYILWSSRTSGTVPPFHFTLITLITYLLSFTLLVLPWLGLAYLSLTPTTHGLLTYQHTWFVLFSFYFLFFAPIVFVFFTKVFYFSPPWSCHPLFTFVFLWLLLSPSWLASASLLLCLFVFVLIVASVVSVRWVSWTDRVCGRSATLLTHGQHHTRTQAIKHVCGGFPPRKACKPRERLSFSPPTPPPLSPLWSRP